MSFIDKNGFFIYASPSHQTILGLLPEVLKGKLVSDLVHEDDYRKLQNKLDLIIETREASVSEYRLRDVSNKWIWMEGTITPVNNEKGDFHYFLVISRDITRRRTLEEKLNYIAYYDALEGVTDRRLFEGK